MDFSAGAVVYKIEQNKPYYLLVFNARKEFWGFPKGHPEKDESLEQTALREIYEETGNKVAFAGDFKRVMRYTLPSGEEKITTLFVAQSIKQDVIILPNKEVEKIMWCSYIDASKLLVYDNQKEALQKAHEFVSHQQRNVT